MHVPKRHEANVVDVPPTWRCPASTDLNAVNDCNVCRNFSLFSSSMYLIWCHCILSCTFALVPLTRWLQCSQWSSQTPDFTRIETAVSASFALHMKRKCCGDVRFSLRLDFWNFDVSPVRARQQLTLLLPLAVFIVFHSCHTPRFLGSCWISESALVELCFRVLRLFWCFSFSACPSPPGSSHLAVF